MLLYLDIENDPPGTDVETSKLLDDIKLMVSPDIEATIPAPTVTATPTKGDSATLGVIALTSIAAGGALTRAVSPGGFCSKLAELIFERSNRTVRFHIITKQKSKIDLVGTADDIAKLLKSGLLADIQN